MKKHKFHYLSAKNFLCYGSDGVELNLDSYGNIIVVRGKNWDDINPITGQPGSNGAGKSTVQEILVFALYGKTVKKKLTQAKVLNRTTQKNLRVEVRWDDYRVIRKLNPNELRFERWDGKKWIDESLGAGGPATQKKIEAAIGLNYKSFVNIVVFDYKSVSFLDCELATKREIVENLLSLDKYRLYNKTAKDLKKDAEKKVKELTDEYFQLNLQLDALRKRLASIDQEEAAWKSKKKQELVFLMQRYKDLEVGLKTSDIGKAMAAYTEAQEEIAALLEEIPSQEEKQDKANQLVSMLRVKQRQVETHMQTAKNEIALLEQKKLRSIGEIQALVADITKMNNAEPGVRCKTCFMEADPDSFATLIAETQKKIDAIQEELDNVIAPDMESKKETFSKLSSMMSLVNSKIKTAEGEVNEHVMAARKARSRVAELQRISKPDASSDVLLIEQKMAEVKDQAKAKKQEFEGPSPFVKIRQQCESDVVTKKEEYESKKAQILEAERLIPYYEYWVAAFGDSGIRKYVIDGIINPLNERIAFWLNYLIYGNISLKFDPELEETIQRVPAETDDPFVYDQMSGGEQRRLNLSIPLSFAHCMELSSGSSPSIVFLDEVAVNIDENGIEGIYNMIRELATEKQVFVTDHNPLLLDLLQGEDSICLERRDRVTKLDS